MKKSLAIYSSGVVTAPVWLYLFRRPVGQIVGRVLAKERYDEPLQRFMKARKDVQVASREKHVQ